MRSRYEIAKNIFIDSIDVDDYIKIDSSVLAYKQLEYALEKPLKMILLFGKPGTGKSILLNYIENKLKDEKEIYYFDTPLINEKEFLSRLFNIFTKKELSTNREVNFSFLVNFAREMRDKREIIILLDEAQMYSVDMMEKIRLFSDTRSVKFVVSLHKTDNEDIIAKEHFQSRIWEIIELSNATLIEEQNYINQKLLKKNLFDILNSIRYRDFKLIHSFTKGNYRECNKVMFTIFEICEYYDKYEISKIKYGYLPRKIIEMAGLKLGYINV